MGNRLSAIITRTGDKGTTGLADGSRRPKNDVRVHCLGEVDELNATLGVALSFLEESPGATGIIRGAARSVRYRRRVMSAGQIVDPEIAPRFDRIQCRSNSISRCHR